MLDNYEMEITAFSVVDKVNRVKFFEKIFLVANVSLKVVFGMSLLTLSNVDINFSVWKLWWRTYTTDEAFLTTRRVKLVGKKEFAAAALDLEYKTYIVHVTSLRYTPSVTFLKFILLNVYPFWRPQISS